MTSLQALRIIRTIVNAMMRSDIPEKFHNIFKELLYILQKYNINEN